MKARRASLFVLLGIVSVALLIPPAYSVQDEDPSPSATWEALRSRAIQEPAEPVCVYRVTDRSWWRIYHMEFSFGLSHGGTVLCTPDFVTYIQTACRVSKLIEMPPGAKDAVTKIGRSCLLRFDRWESKALPEEQRADFSCIVQKLSCLGTDASNDICVRAASAGSHIRA